MKNDNLVAYVVQVHVYQVRCRGAHVEQDKYSPKDNIIATTALVHLCQQPTSYP